MKVNNFNISLKKATFLDIEFLWYLRNQTETYKHFKNPKPVTWEDHIDWIVPIILGIADRDVFVIKNLNIPIGQIRFDYETSDISISILKEFQSKGIATKSLVMAIKKIKREKKVNKIIAEINKDNLPSIKLFEKLGFKFEKKGGEWLKYKFNL